MTAALEKAGSGSVEPEDFNAVVDAVNASSHGGSQPVTREAFRHLNVTIASGATIPNNLLPWTKNGGDDLLDLTDPKQPLIITAGVYAITVNVMLPSFSTDFTTDWYWIGLDTDTNDADAFADVNFPLGTTTGLTGLNRAGAASVTYYQPAGSLIQAQVRHREGSDITFDFFAFVQRLA